jgi:hypothetical protein
MIPDILGYDLKDGIDLIKKSGIDDRDIFIKKYISPGKENAGNDTRILRVDMKDGKIILIVGGF